MFLIIADNEVKTTAATFKRAELMARNWSLTCQQAKIFCLTTRSVYGQFDQGLRVSTNKELSTC